MASVQAGRHVPAFMGGWARFAMRATRPSGEEFSARSRFALVDAVVACAPRLVCALARRVRREPPATLAQLGIQALAATHFRVATAALDIVALRSHARVTPRS